MKNVITDVTVDILFNGKPAKQYTKDGELFIEAKDSSECEISIRNTNSFRIEAVVSVDGLDVITGEQSTPKSTGYVIDKYDTLKIKGYRISDTEVAAFKFCKKEESYATATTVNAQNGVINIRCFREKEKPIQLEDLLEVVTKRKRYIYEDEWVPAPRPYWPSPRRFRDPMCEPIWVGNTTFTTPLENYCNNSINSNSVKYSCNITSKSASNSEAVAQFLNCVNTVTDSTEESTPSNHFDMGMAFGPAKESKVVTVEFKRGSLLGEINIFYASRKLLESMGINLTNEQKIVFPVGVSKYCKPPTGWKR